MLKPTHRLQNAIYGCLLSLCVQDGLKSKPQTLIVHIVAIITDRFSIFYRHILWKYLIKWLLNIPPRLNCVGAFPSVGLSSVGISLKELANWGVRCRNIWNFVQGLKFNTDFHSKMSVCRHELGGSPAFQHWAYPIAVCELLLELRTDSEPVFRDPFTRGVPSHHRGRRQIDK